MRRHLAPILLVLLGVFLIGSACVVRTRPAHQGRPATYQKHKKVQKKHAKQHRKHDKD